jgi:DNA-binding MarR family transcriptional regulator
VAGEVHTDNDFTLRQMAVVLTLQRPDDPQTVRGLARHLVVKKPAIPRAFDRLSEAGRCAGRWTRGTAAALSRLAR